MKILWITNSPFSEAFKGIRLEDNTKGWINSAAYGLINFDNKISLGIVSLYPDDNFNRIEINKIKHYLLPKRLKNNKSQLKKYWNEILEDFNPDIIHIHGTEYPFLYFFVTFSKFKNIVVSIQGLISVIERYYLGGIKKTDLIKNVTFWDIIRVNTIFSQHKNIHRRGKIEKLLIKSVNHVIGRTTWDRNHVLAINPDIHYHFCNETLRPSFYKMQWNFLKCEKYSIFISQAYYPIKGFHQLIKALPSVLKYFPKTKVYVAGNDLFTKRGFKRNGYGQYINALINRYQLFDKIEFLDLLSEEEICNRLCRSHIFVSPSAIENSSNSIGEAQILGVPSIASYVGGTPDIIEHNKTGILYRFEEIEMLSASICKLFSDNELATQISTNSQKVAKIRHNKEINAKRLHNIYLEIFKPQN